MDVLYRYITLRGKAYFFGGVGGRRRHGSLGDARINIVKHSPFFLLKPFIEDRRQDNKEEVRRWKKKEEKEKRQIRHLSFKCTTAKSQNQEGNKQARVLLGHLGACDCP